MIENIIISYIVCDTITFKILTVNPAKFTILPNHIDYCYIIMFLAGGLYKYKNIYSRHTCQNHTLCVEITPVRVEIIVVSVLMTSLVLKSQFMWKLHSACRNSTRSCRNHTCECHIHTHTCQNYSRVSGNHTLRVKSHSACGNRTLRVETNLVRVVITLLRVVITFVRVEITLMES
jgi:hypothetical protein